MKTTIKALLATTLLALTTLTVHAQRAVSGEAVLSLTKQYLAAAPKRALGTPGHAAAEKFIRDHFAPEAAKGNFVADSFYARTPAGQMTMTNYIVKFPSTNAAKKDGIIVLASHYETNYPLQNINFVGANDGACTTALLIAIGQYLRVHPPAGYSVWLLFTDGEEAVKDWSPTDSLYGTRHLAAKWSADGTISHIKAFLLADMIGWSKMKIDRDMNSTPWLVDDLVRAGKDTGHAAYIRPVATQGIDDDHMPFKVRGVPVLDVICFEYGNDRDPEAYHHHESDSIDKISASSLQVSADIFLDLIKQVSQH